MIFSGFFKQKTDEDKLEAKRAAVYRSMLRQEAKVGGELFGPVPQGARREFFCMDPHTWIWHEEWQDENGKLQVRTTRYDIRPNGVVKAQNGQPYHMVTLPEAENLEKAVNLYCDRVAQEVYGQTA